MNNILRVKIQDAIIHISLGLDNSLFTEQEKEQILNSVTKWDKLAMERLNRKTYDSSARPMDFVFKQLGGK